MLSVGREQFKVGWVVIGNVSVNVVDDFFRAERPT
jgi:hypothetical protein